MLINRSLINRYTDENSFLLKHACPADGQFLPMQLFYKGKIKQSLPKYTFPKYFEVIFNEKHWANESTAISFIENIIVPYVNDEKVLLGLPEAQKTLLVYYDVLEKKTLKTW